MYQGTACFAYKQLVVWQNISQPAGYFYKGSTSAIEFISRQSNTVDSFQSFELACQFMEMLNKR